jgi:hypothetical protein
LGVYGLRHQTGAANNPYLIADLLPWQCCPFWTAQICCPFWTVRGVKCVVDHNDHTNLVISMFLGGKNDVNQQHIRPISAKRRRVARSQSCSGARRHSPPKFSHSRTRSASRRHPVGRYAIVGIRRRVTARARQARACCRASSAGRRSGWLHSIISSARVIRADPLMSAHQATSAA